MKHADILHTFAMEQIQELGKVFKAPAEMQEEWDKSHVHYVEKAAWIKKMLDM